jgi:hypothetical protein
MTAACQQGLPPAPILLKTIIVDQKSSLGRICWKSVGRDFISRDAKLQSYHAVSDIALYFKKEQ